ncbi:MAG: acetolactate synthase large subunit, partial [Alphaproteobacteria bacterium]|nr:acetolactate synthase large subunit [Alphaproteobacteria bacterium]
MNGAESLVATLLKGDVNVCFTNPGTSEMHFVAALDQYEKMRSILCLFEGCATGAADGYFRMQRTPASTLLHLGPGLANGLANLHNAKKASSGIVNIVGEHALDHIKLNAPLTSDIEGIARPVSHWVKTSKSSKEIAIDGAEAIKVAKVNPGQIATLILPGDTAWNEGNEPESVEFKSSSNKVPTDSIQEGIEALQSAKNPLILVGGAALEEKNLIKIAKIADKMNCQIKTDWFNARLDKGAGRINSVRIPYVVDNA